MSHRAVAVPGAQPEPEQSEHSTAVSTGSSRVTPVALGASQGNDVEVTEGVPASTSLLGDGVVLLKPVIAEVLQSETNP